MHNLSDFLLLILGTYFYIKWAALLSQVTFHCGAEQFFCCKLLNLLIKLNLFLLTIYEYRSVIKSEGCMQAGNDNGSSVENAVTNGFRTASACSPENNSEEIKDKASGVPCLVSTCVSISSYQKSSHAY